MAAKAQNTAYSDTPLPKKLGLITSGEKPVHAALLGAPPGFLATLGELPVQVKIQSRLSPQTTLALCFVRTPRELESSLEMLAMKLPHGASAWIIRPKAHHKPGFNENHVRDAALPLGLVDYKICSGDADWSGIKFAWRKTKKITLLPAWDHF